MHLTDKREKVRVSLPIGKTFTDVVVIAVLADFIMHDFMQDVDGGCHLRELMWHSHLDEQGLIGACQHHRDPVVLPSRRLLDHLRVWEELVDLADLLLAHALQRIHAHHLLLLVHDRYTMRVSMHKVSRPRNMRSRYAHNIDLLLTWLTELLVSHRHAHRRILAVTLRLHSIHTWLLLTVLAMHGLHATSHDITCWVSPSSVLMILHFNIIVFN